MLDLKVFHPVIIKELPGNRIIPSSLFLKEKLGMKGEFLKLKARLVAGGHMQDRNMYQEDLYSPTVKTESIFMLAAIAASKGCAVATADVTAAYLNAFMKKPGGRRVWMRIANFLAEILCALRPDWRTFILQDGSIVVELDKCLYGCIESAQQWFFTLEAELKRLGYEQNPYDKCVFTKGSCMIAFHVDDLLIIAATEDEIDTFFAEFTTTFPNVAKHRGTTHHYLGMIFNFKDNHTVEIDCGPFLQQFLQDYTFSGRAATPATENWMNQINSVTLKQRIFIPV